jgi:CubicO group peptidase (beta-lactamase class C family)
MARLPVARVNRSARTALAACGVFALLLFSACTPLRDMRTGAPASRALVEFPAGDWRRSTPEAQGVDSDALVEVFDAIARERMPIHSLQLVRHGYLVLDAYFFPFAQGQRHDVASVTKSVTTTLVGQAIARGDLPAVDTPVWPMLATGPLDDARKLDITLRHLLTTSSGLACGTEPYEREMLEMAHSTRWVAYALALPVAEPAGRRFNYCSPGFHLMSALLSRRSGRSAEQLARADLFGPLGIEDFVWPRDPQGINQGAGDLQMLPTDMAKLGYLFLHLGNWAGQQVVPRAWVQQATRRQIDTPSGTGYGFGWWLPADLPGVFEANGRGGQRIVVWPAKDLVMVSTGGGFDPARLAAGLLRALKGERALADNPAAVQRLQARIASAATPPAARGVPVAPPADAAQIEGQTYRFEDNLLGLRAFRLSGLRSVQALIELELPESRLEVPLGLDGVFRFASGFSNPGGAAAESTRSVPGATVAGPRQAAAVSQGLIGGRASWTGTHELHLEIDTVGRINYFELKLRFSDRRVDVSVAERGGLLKTELVGRSAGR